MPGGYRLAVQKAGKDISTLVITVFVRDGVFGLASFICEVDVEIF